MKIRKKSTYAITIFALVIIILGILNLSYIIKKSKQTDETEKKILYWRAPMDPNYISDKPGKSPMGMDLVPVYVDENGEISESEDKDNFYWTCSMHPEVISEEPGNCPICGMKLVKKSKGSGQSNKNVVQIDPVTVQNIGVRTDIVMKIPLSKTIRTTGNVDYNEKKIAYVNTKIGGWIEQLHADYTGKLINKGSPLLELYSPELVSTQEEYLRALKFSEKMKSSSFTEIAEGAHSLLESAKLRLQYWDITDKQIQNLEKTGKVKKTLTIHSPEKGFIIHKNAVQGVRVNPGENLFKIADLSTIWIYADIYEYELPWIKTGQKAEISLSYKPGKTYEGTITYIYPYLENKTRTAKIRIEIENPGYILKPDMYVEVKITSGDERYSLVIPSEAVIYSGKRKIAIVDLGKGKFLPKEIITGIETDSQIEVLKGLEEGEHVVTSSNFLIDSESRLKEALDKMFTKDQTISENQHNH